MEASVTGGRGDRECTLYRGGKHGMQGGRLQGMLGWITGYVGEGRLEFM